MKWKKFLAVLLAVAMVMAGSVVGFADDGNEDYGIMPLGGGDGGQYVRIYDGKSNPVQPEEVVEFDVSVNEEVQSVMLHYGVNIGEVERFETVSGNFQLEYGSDRITFTLTKEEREIGTRVEDVLWMYLDNGESYYFNIVAVVADIIALDLYEVRDDRGNIFGDQRDSFSGFYYLSVPGTGTYTFDIVVEIKDIATTAPNPSYTYEVTDGGRGTGWDDNGEATLGTASRNGKYITIPVTFICNVYYDNAEAAIYPIAVRVEVQKEGAAESVFKYFSFTVYPESNNDNDNNPSVPNPRPDPTPDTTPDSAPSIPSAKENHTDTRNVNYETMKAALRDLEDANNGKTSKVKDYTTAAGVTVPAVPVRLNGAAASVTVEAMEKIAAGSTGLSVSLDGGAAELLLPAGFPMPANTGLLSYPIGIQQNPTYGSLIMGRVKGADAQSEVIRVGGDITLPTTATVTLKTQLKGTVNIYVWDEDTRKVTFLTAAAVQNGKVTFATRQLGGFLLTTGTV